MGSLSVSPTKFTLGNKTPFSSETISSWLELAGVFVPIPTWAVAKPVANNAINGIIFLIILQFLINFNQHFIKFSNN